jgi:hypothetical protein
MSIESQIKNLKFSDGVKIFLTVLAFGCATFFLLYNNGLAAFARDGEFFIIGSILCLIYSSIDNIFYKDINTNELFKKDAKAYSNHLLGYVACFAIAALLLK